VNDSGQHDSVAALERSLDEELAHLRVRLQSVQDLEQLYRVQVEFLGKKGSFTKITSRLGALEAEQRKTFGRKLNDVKALAEQLLGQQRERLAAVARAHDLARHEDLTLPEHGPIGTLHILTQTRRALEATFLTMGFDIVEGPHVEHERYNFDDLNFLPDHPARDMQDTLFVEGRYGERGCLLRTHTSPVQVRTMLARTPPLRVVAPGTTFRRDDDTTHSPMFHQLEGLYVDRGVSMADLKATLYRFVRSFFGASLEVRFRPSFFPFVEPGAEFDVACPFCHSKGCSTCKGAGFIELGGSGMVHPAVFEAVGYDPEAWTGWAFGFGIDRMAMLLHGIRDVKLLFEGDIRFLEQFPC